MDDSSEDPSPSKESLTMDTRSRPNFHLGSISVESPDPDLSKKGLHGTVV